MSEVDMDQSGPSYGDKILVLEILFKLNFIGLYFFLVWFLYSPNP